MPAPVVAENAIHVADAEKIVCGKQRLLIVGFLQYADAQRRERQRTRQPIQIALRRAVFAQRRQQFRAPLVVGLARFERGLNPLVKRIAPVRAARRREAWVRKIPKQPAKEHRPFVHPFGLGEQFVNQLRAPVRRLVGQKRFDSFRRRNAPDQIQRDAPNEFQLGAGLRGHDLRRRQRVEDVTINRVGSGFNSLRLLGNGCEPSRDVGGQIAGSVQGERGLRLSASLRVAEIRTVAVVIVRADRGWQTSGDEDSNREQQEFAEAGVHGFSVSSRERASRAKRRLPCADVMSVYTARAPRKESPNLVVI